MISLLTDPRITHFWVGLEKDGLFAVEITFRGFAKRKHGFAHMADTYQWAQYAVAENAV